MSPAENTSRNQQDADLVVACEADAWALGEWRERWFIQAQRAERAEAEVERLKAALYKLAEDAEVAHQGGLHNDGGES